jgi:riboflavin kinase / FMN adenylyltransferase
MLSLTGTIVHGKGEARGTGYPTANLAYEGTKPDAGVWTCRVEFDGGTHHGLGVIGMWELDSGLPSVEVYVLDMDADLYEKELVVTPLIKLRDLMQFETTAALVTQIQKDIEDARDVFGL